MHKNTINQSNKQEEIDVFSIQNKKVEISFEGESISSNAGLLLLKEVEGQIGIIKSLSQIIKDERDQRYVEHTMQNLLLQRVFQIASGNEDANDSNIMRNDAILKICAEKFPQTDPALASQSTMSRLENSVSRTDLYRIAECFAMNFIKSYCTEPEVIIIDCDDTNNNAHGHQLEIEYNDYYGEYCYMPLHIYEGLSGKLITTILKPGRRSKGAQVFTIIKRVINFIRRHWKKTKLIVRGDSHFCSQEFMDWAKNQYEVHFITGLTGNKALTTMTETTVKSAEKSFKSNKKAVKMYHTFEYQAKTWKEQQRVIVKVEVNERGTNIRYIVTDLREYRTKQLYELGYCGRGRMELNIKDHKTYLKSDKSSCNRFESNAFRLFLHSAAYVLIHTLQKEVLKGTDFCNATMQTVQLKLIKVAAFVKELKTKIKIELPRTTVEKNIIEKCLGIFKILRC